MCGITGYIDVVIEKQLATKTINAMTSSLHHRGPDGGDTFIDLNQQYTIALGHRRLSIIDLSDFGAQPMSTSDQSLTIVFNGEIYNYKEIQSLLIQKGYEFKSKSDTEVVLYSFQEWGMDCAKRFIGMFAFAIYDKQNKKIFLCRDRLGVKPLFYYHKENLLLFASEVRSFHQHPMFVKKIATNAVGLYIQNGYISENKSIFQNVSSIEVGHWKEIDLSAFEMRDYCFWSISDKTNYTVNQIDFSNLSDQLEELMISAFNYRLVSDVPVGVFLSGGVDSSLLTAILTKNSALNFTTFTVGFDDKKYDESPYAEGVSKHFRTTHITKICSVSDASSLFMESAKVFDQPFGDSSSIPMMMVCKMASEELKVVLSADGGDELFYGYPHYKIINSWVSFMLRIPLGPRKVIAKAASKIFSGLRYTKYGSLLLVFSEIIASETSYALSKSINSPFTNMNISNLLTEEWSNNDHSLAVKYFEDILHEIQKIDIKNFMQDDILVKIDRTSMHYSLECREPFLDHRLVEFASLLPSSVNINKDDQKILLKNLLKKYMPNYDSKRPKRGFDSPIRNWMLKDLRPQFDYFLSDEMIEASGVFKKNEVQKLKHLFLNGKRVRGLDRRLWFILNYQLWHSEWINPKLTD